MDDPNANVIRVNAREAYDSLVQQMRDEVTEAQARDRARLADALEPDVFAALFGEDD